MCECYFCKHYDQLVVDQEYKLFIHKCNKQKIFTASLKVITKNCPLTQKEKCKVKKIGEKIMNHKKDEENIMLEEKLTQENNKKQRKKYKNPNSKTMMHKIKKLLKK